MKICSKCNKDHPLELYSSNRSRKDGKCVQCKLCMRASKSRWASNNASKVSKYQVSYRPKYRAKDCNRVRHNASTQHSLAYKRGAVKCSCCKSSDLVQFYVDRPDGMTVDHIVECQDGGKHCLENLQYLSRADNTRKSHQRSIR